MSGRKWINGNFPKILEAYLIKQSNVNVDYNDHNDLYIYIYVYIIMRTLLRRMYRSMDSYNICINRF